MKMPLHVLCLMLLLTTLSASTPGFAQQNKTPYTGNNRVLVTLEGETGLYQFSSEQMLVRYNKQTQQLECLLPVSTLVPLQDTIPASMAYEVLYGAKYPQLLLTMKAPEQLINAGGFAPITMPRTVAVNLQGVLNETVIPVGFTSEKDVLFFTSTFDLMLDNFQATLPVAYAQLLSGRLRITIDRARVVNLNLR
ncbi:hypothetical protein [Pontibacter mangrovi]|uniref:YceI family protein n=1 Tax=Pontibacter mangrovi TaxID=2589816 RepID=A0A501W9I8_9BACT|nr:hypothetical protein [Pontibacter mangrovi]TPE46028.1 hypothetical protein FJM65_01405 [Pontibacter mangrovi]